MEIPKAKVLEFVVERGKNDEIVRADEELPESIDVDRDADLLARFGIEPDELMNQFNGGATRRRVSATTELDELEGNGKEGG